MGTVFGQAWLQWDLILASAALIALLALGIWAVIAVRKWRRESAEAAEPALDHYQEMAEAGLLGEEEMKRIKAQLERPPEPPADKPTPPPGQPDTDSMA